MTQEQIEAKLTQSLEDYNHKAHSVFMLTYHIVFVTKYRKRVINREIGDFYSYSQNSAFQRSARQIY